MPNKVKIVTVGDGAVGKTSILMTYSTDVFPTKYVPTVFDNFSTDVMLEDRNITMDLWDTAGQEEYDRLRPICYQNCHSFIVCYSIIDPVSLQHVESKWIPEIRKFCPGIPFVLVGTKSDLREDAQSPVDPAIAKKMGTDLGASDFLECSARTQAGLKNVMMCAAKIACAARKKKKRTVCVML